MPACRTQRPRRSRSKWSNAARTSACGCRPDAGWPGKRGAHRALAARFRRSHHAPRSWPLARGGSARVSRPPGRRSSSSSQCGSTAATAPRRGRPQACRPTALDGTLSAFERAARPPGRSVRCRGARRRERTCTGTRALPSASAAAHRRRPSLRRWLACARLATTERSRARSRGASARQCKAVSTTRSTSLCGAQSGRSDSVTPMARTSTNGTALTSIILEHNVVPHIGQLYSGQTQWKWWG